MIAVKISPSLLNLPPEVRVMIYTIIFMKRNQQRWDHPLSITSKTIEAECLPVLMRRLLVSISIIGGHGSYVELGLVRKVDHSHILKSGHALTSSFARLHEWPNFLKTRLASRVFSNMDNICIHLNVQDACVIIGLEDGKNVIRTICLHESLRPELKRSARVVFEPTESPNPFSPSFIDRSVTESTPLITRRMR